MNETILTTPEVYLKSAGQIKDESEKDESTSAGKKILLSCEEFHL